MQVTEMANELLWKNGVDKIRVENPKCGETDVPNFTPKDLHRVIHYPQFTPL